MPDMKQPVTELYEAAEEAAAGLGNDAMSDASRQEIGATLLKRIGRLDIVAAGSVGTSNLLDILDRVATLPHERLEALKEWLNEKPICQTCCHRGHASACEDAAQAMREHRRPVAVEKEIDDLEDRLSEVRARIRSYDGGDRPSSPPMSLFHEEQDLIARIEAKENADSTPVPTILPAGKPPPFLRVGMVLNGGRNKRTYVLALVETTGQAVIRHQYEARARLIDAAIGELIPLAEDFTVEEES